MQCEALPPASAAVSRLRDDQPPKPVPPSQTLGTVHTACPAVASASS
jgi:hypothetical protein